MPHDPDFMSTVGELLVRQVTVRICEENIPRLVQCLGLLTTEQIWHRPVTGMASIGHLILHLNGNARQWILDTLCGIPYTRDRNREFEETAHLTQEALTAILTDLDRDLKAGLPLLTTDRLLQVHEVQVFREDGVSVLVHAIEHFSYHSGQVARETKRCTGRDLGFYAHHAL